MKNALFLILFIGLSMNVLKAQIALDSLGLQNTMDSLLLIQNVNNLEIIDLQVYLQPCDTAACQAAMACHNPDSALYSHLATTGHAHAEIVVQVKDPSLVHRLHLKAGRSPGANHFVARQTPFRTINNPPQGITITLVSENTLVIHIDRCLQAIPFYLEAWLEDDNGVLSSIETFSIQQ